MAVPPGAPDSIMITSPSTSSMISDRHLDVSHLLDRLHGVPSYVKESDLNASLPPTPEFARFPHPSDPSPPEYPSRSPTSAFFPVTVRRKTSLASQHPPHLRTSSSASSSSEGGYSMPPPALPIRSPLRKPNKSLVSFTGGFNLAETSPVPLPPPSPTTSIPPGSPNGLNLNGQPLPRDSFSSWILLNANTNPSVISLSTQDYSSNAAAPAASGSSPSLSRPFSSAVVSETGAKPGAKRRHALLELLTSERSYAADLAVVKNIYIPLSKGLTTPSSSTSLTPSQTQTQSQNKPSDSELPMTFEASKTIFGNIEELAQFADVFAERLELALGDVLDGGQGKDSVGALFLEVIPQIADKFKTYITRHPTALVQFQSLPQCAVLAAYLAETKSLADSHTHAWDIPSLLIKPVQRLLQYPPLIAQIIGCTPDDHPDKVSLVEAKDRIEEVSRAVNEGRRRWEVVKAVLAQNVDAKVSAKEGAASPSNEMTPARPKVGRMRSFRSKIKPGVADSDSGKAKDEMEEWEKRLKDCEMACKELAKGSLQWCRDVQFTFKKLKAWNASFGNVVGLGEHGVEAIGAFSKVVSGLQTLWTDLDNTLQSVLLPQLQKLVKSLSSPQILLAHMHTLYHSHITLLNTPYNKSRPPNALIEASQDFLALRATLREELPSFFFMFEKGLGLVLVEFSRWQGRLYREVKDRWMQFWIALAVDDGEANPEGVISGIGSGSEETVAIWRERFEEVQEVLNSFRTIKKPLPAPQMRSKSQPHLPQPPLQLQPSHHEKDKQKETGRELERDEQERASREEQEGAKTNAQQLLYAKTSGHPIASTDASNEPNTTDISDLDLVDKIIVGDQITGGGFSSISKGTLLMDGSNIEVAIKSLRMQGPGIQTVKERLQKRFYREVLLWRMLQHSNVVPLLGFMMLPNESPTLISPWYINGNIIDYLASNSSADRYTLALDVVNGLDYLHSIPIAHGDLKGENVLVNEDGRASLCDFGMSQFIDEASRIVGFTTPNAYIGGTDRFMCPELLLDEPKSAATDMWALGCLVVQILTDIIPYEQINRRQAVLAAIMRGEPPMVSYNGDIDILLWGCIKKCWSIAKEDRPDASELGLRLAHSGVYKPGLPPTEDIKEGDIGNSLTLLRPSRWTTDTGYSQPRIKFSPDGKYLAAADLDGTVDIREIKKDVHVCLKTWTSKRSFWRQNEILNISWSSSQRYLLVKAKKFTKVFMIETNKSPVDIEDCKWAALFPTADAISTLDQRGIVSIRDLAQLDDILLDIKLDSPAADIKEIVLSPNNRHMVTLTTTALSVYSLKTGKVEASAALNHRQKAAKHISLSKNGHFILVSGPRQNPELWGIDHSRSDIELHCLRQYNNSLTGSRSAGSTFVQFGGTEDQLIIGVLGSISDGGFHIWDRSTAQLVYSFAEAWLLSIKPSDMSFIWNSLDPQEIMFAIIGKQPLLPGYLSVVKLTGESVR